MCVSTRERGACEVTHRVDGKERDFDWVCVRDSRRRVALLPLIGWLSACRAVLSSVQSLAFSSRKAGVVLVEGTGSVPNPPTRKQLLSTVDEIERKVRYNVY